MTTVDAPEYTPGDWVAVVTDGAVALLPPTTAEPVLRRLWESLRSAAGAGVVDHLQVLVRDGLATLPPFALLTLDGTRLHAVVRGAVEVGVTTAGRSFVLTAPGVSTWSDEVVDGVQQVTVRAPGEPAVGVALPLVTGVARATTIRLRTAVRSAAPDAAALDAAGPDAGTATVERAGRAAGTATDVPTAAPAVPAVPVGRATASAIAAVPVGRAVAAAVAAVPDQVLSAHAPATPAAGLDLLRAPVLPAPGLPTPAIAGDVLADDVAIAGEPLDITVLRPATGPVPLVAPGTDGPELAGGVAARSGRSPVELALDPAPAGTDTARDVAEPVGEVAEPVVDAVDRVQEADAQVEDAAEPVGDAAEPAQPPAAPTGGPSDLAPSRPTTARPTSRPVAARQAAPGSTDHDGTTVLSADVVELRRALPEWAGHAMVSAPVTAPLTPRAPAPAPARLALSTGERVTLTRPVLLGRAPQASRVHSSQVPQLVTVPSPLQDISRTHAEVRMDGDDVVLTDLHSTNGVLVVRPASTPQRLQPGEATVLQPGVLVDLGEGVTFTVERSA